MWIDADIALVLSIIFLGAAASYIAGIAMDGVMGADGFGTLINALILMTGGFIGYYAQMHLPIFGRDATWAAVMAVGGAFTGLALLAILKALSSRMGF
ncbi:hypothetical protein [Oricola cellulosilytica]|uniref:GlsB/YeaQ/YmgE family stress response membrane protein n=1 Tax=Oricola cellulosilytica TaxID=1429082 RepID=A0A4R0P480_9HYPH|nr:hypothetical protein [Oricola cellulosilytica]TCD11406.1 hypothetical protein E0D97_17015 [Oricola cellulosilytica]